MSDIDDINGDMDKLITGMACKLGRMPTEDEVYNFIYGTEGTRTAILNGKFHE